MSKPTDSELDILQVLWDHQPCTVRTIHEILANRKEVGYTTTLKQMQRMEEKGLIMRETITKGKSILYSAVEKERHIKSRLVDKLKKRVFGNSISELMLHAIGKDKVSREELEKIKELINQLDNNTDNE
jgi:predicted transcriptional regulator